MHLPSRTVTLATAALAWLVVKLVRTALAPVRSRRRLLEDLRAPQRFLAVYVLAGAVALFDAVHPAVAHGASTIATIAGLTSLLRLGDVAVFGLLRRLGRPAPQRILHSLGLSLCTAVIAAAVLRTEYHLDLSSLLATSALLSVVLGFALQETMGNLFAGLTLNSEQPFEAGDWVSFGKYTGKVIDVGWRSTRLLTVDEHELLVPNSLISREVVINHLRPHLTDVVDLVVTVDLDASPARAKEVLREAVRSSPLVLATPEPVVRLARFSPVGADYRVRFTTSSYLVEQEALDQVQEAIWYALRRAGIAMPFPQTTISLRESAAEGEQRRRREHREEAVDLLSRIDFLQALSPEARGALADRALFLEYGPGQAVVREGDAGDTLYLVARGELAVRVQAAGAEPREVARLSRGAFFGEMSVLTGEPRSATVVALGDAALLAVDREAFQRVLEAEPGLAARVAEAMARRRRGLAEARAGAADTATVAQETNDLLSRIRSMFGFSARRSTGS